MALNRFDVVGSVMIIVMFMLMLSDGATTESSECRGPIVSLSPCLDYVSGNLSTPSHSCCSQLANVVRSEPRCLCALVSHRHSSNNFKINETLALGLPDACNVQTPPVSRCDGNGSKTAPTTSDGTMINLSFYSKIVFLLVASDLLLCNL